MVRWCRWYRGNARSVVCVWACVAWTPPWALCKNGWTDWDAASGV